VTPGRPATPSTADARAANLLGALALSVGDAVEAAVEGAGGRGGATPAALVLLHDEPGMSVTELGRATGLSQPGAVRMVEELERSGLVIRGPGADARTHALRVTPLGSRRVRRILAARAAVLDRSLEPLPSAERRTLEGLLDRLLEAWTDDEAHAVSVCRLCDTDACPPDRCPAELGWRASAG
jgi:DNA-binding MarR family transcriptional regulator